MRCERASLSFVSRSHGLWSKLHSVTLMSDQWNLWCLTGDCRKLNRVLDMWASPPALRWGHRSSQVHLFTDVSLLTPIHSAKHHMLCTTTTINPRAAAQLSITNTVPTCLCKQQSAIEWCLSGVLFVSEKCQHVNWTIRLSVAGWRWRVGEVLGGLGFMTLSCWCRNKLAIMQNWKINSALFPSPSSLWATEDH